MLVELTTNELDIIINNAKRGVCTGKARPMDLGFNKRVSRIHRPPRQLFSISVFSLSLAVMQVILGSRPAS
jgi:hypothetical protein